MIALVVLAVVFITYALVAARLDRWSVTAPMVFVLTGTAIGLFAPDWVGFLGEPEPVKLIAELTLALLLFADASTLRWRELREDGVLPARLLLDPGEQLWEEPDHFRMERELGFFEQERARAIEHCPQETDEPKGAVGEILLGLPGAMRPPVLVLASEMRCADLVAPELQVFELGDGDPERLLFRVFGAVRLSDGRLA